jgi:DNA-binding MarR family transcriptional regulator
MWRVLAALNQRDGQSIGVLAAATSNEKSTLSRLLDQMQKKRLLLRQRDGADQRSITIHRTPAAQAITEKLIPVALRCERKALAGFAQSDESTLRAMLRRVYENLDALEGGDRHADGKMSEKGRGSR